VEDVTPLTIVLLPDPSREDWVCLSALVKREELEEDVQWRLDGRGICSCRHGDEVQCQFTCEVERVCGQCDWSRASVVGI
jgi:hypothetical protein